ncbi:MAG: nucleobase:cation symporter-2 family protein [Eubacteriales bacterium]
MKKEPSKTEGNQASVFDLDGVPAFWEALPLALQHIVAMIVGCVTPPLIIANTVGLSPEDRVILIQAGMTMAALTTFVQLFPIARKTGLGLGSGLPVIMGVSFAYLPSMQAIALSETGISGIFGSMIVGGFVAMFVGCFMKKIRKFFPPLITGTVVFTIGLSLYPTAVNYMAGGVGSADFGSVENWSVALFTLCVVTGLSHYGKGMVKLAAILIGMTVGYVLAFAMGMIDFQSVAEAGFFQLPQFMHFGISFNLSACIALGILFAINSIQAIGDFSATTMGGLNRVPTDRELQNGVFGYGLSNVFCSFFGGLPTASFSQNVGIVSTTKVVNRCILGMAAGILLLAGLVPKFSALLTTIPACVLGGATISVFASIAMTGIKLITSEEMNYRNSSVVGLSVALGMGITQSSNALGQFPSEVVMIFGTSPVVITTIVALLLNNILPKSTS